MGSPLSPVMINFFMEHFEKAALKPARYKPTHWYRYVDGTFIVWPHGDDKLKDFMDHLNNRHPSIQFTEGEDREGKIVFLDVLERTATGRLAHGVIKTLVNRAKIISEEEHLHMELENSLQADGYSRKDIQDGGDMKKITSRITTT